MKNLLADLLDLVFPNICPGCNAPFASGEVILCTNCNLDLPIHTDNRELLKVFSGRIEIAEIAVYLKFYSGGITQRLLHEIKYRKNLELARYVGRSFMQINDNRIIFEQVDLIVPVPLHKSKLKERGYNQSKVIAEGMAEILDKPIETAGILRIKKSETQTRKSRSERWQNVSGIFSVTGAQYKNQHILLVDDVLTTGATLEACAQAILNAGAKKLSIATLAMA